MDRIGMAKIMKSWLTSGGALAAEDGSTAAQTLKGDFGSLPRYRTSTSGAKEWRIIRCTLSPTSSDVALQNPNQVSTDRYEAGLIEFCLADMDDAVTNINIRHSESQCL